MKIYRNFPLFLVFLLLAVGCGPSGPKMYPVTGVVSRQGTPLPLGTVMFVAKNGQPCGPAIIDAHGRYQLDAAAGEYAVAVVALPPRQGGRPDPNIEGGFDYTGVPRSQSLIPLKFNRHDTSGITVVVKPEGPNQIDIPITWRMR